MKRVIALILVVSCLNVVAAPSMEEFGKQVSYFYKNPTKENFEKFQKDAEGLRKEIPPESGAKLLVSVMIARVSEKHNWPIMETSFSQTAKEILEGKTKLAKFVNNDQAVNPDKLDIWWCSLFATGDMKYLENIFLYVGKDVEKEKDLKNMLVYGAANWSFKSNCEQHKIVLDFAKKKLKEGKLSDYKKAYLEECVACVKEK